MRWLKSLKYACMFGFCLLLLLLFPSCTPAYAAGTYTITAAELTQLEANLSRLEENSRSKQALLQTQSEQLRKLNEQLAKSLRLNEETRNSLRTAEESLREYEAEAKRKQAIKDRQRNTWAAAFFGALVWAVVK